MAEQEDVEGVAEEEGNVERFECSDPFEFAEEAIGGDHYDGKGDHHGGDAKVEYFVAVRPVDARKSVGGEGAREHGADNREEGDVEGVAGVAPKLSHGGNRLREVFPFPLGGNPNGWQCHGFFEWFESGGNHPQERCRKLDGEESEQRVEQDVSEEAEFMSRHRWIAWFLFNHRKHKSHKRMG